MPPEKKLNCNPEVLEKMKKDKVLVRTVTYVQKKDSDKSETIVKKVPIQDKHITGCRVYKDVKGKQMYSVTAMDGRHKGLM